MRVLLLLILSFTSFSVFGQTDRQVLQRVQQEAQAMSDAFHKQDFDTFLDYTHPSVVESIGGRERMKAFLKEGFNTEISFVKTDISEAKKLIKKERIWQCAMKQAQVIKLDGKEYMVQGWLIGISYNSGELWRFISVSNQTLQTLQRVFPELSNKLRVKPQKEPRLLIKDF